MIPLAQNSPTKLKNISFILNYTTPLVITGFKQLCSSICCQAMAGQSFALNGKIMPFLKSFELGQKLGF